MGERRGEDQRIVDHVFVPTGSQRPESAALGQTLSSTTKPCKSKASIFPSGKRSVRSFLLLRRLVSLSVSISSFKSSYHRLANSDWYLLADGLDPVSSGSIGGGGDVAMGVIETSLAALQAGSALVSNVPFISPVAGLILQALKMRGVRSEHSLYMSRVLTSILNRK